MGIDDQMRAIERARRDYEWSRVRDLATELLEGEDLPPETAVQLLQQRARAFEYLGDLDACVADLETAVSWAKSADLLHHYVRILNQLVFIFSQFSREFERGLQAAETALHVAERLQAGDLEAECHLSISWTHYQLYNQSQLKEHAQRALLLSEEHGNRIVKAGCTCCLALYALRYEGEEQKAIDLIEQSLALFHQLGRQTAAAWVHHSAAFERSDLAAKRGHYEQTLYLARETNHAIWQFHGINGVANDLLSLGLYQRAQQILLEAVEASPSRNLSIYWYLLSTLADCYRYLGQYERVGPVLEEMRSVDKDTRRVETALRLMTSGQITLGLGQYDEALAQLRLASDLFEELDYPSYQGLALAWLGAAALAKGDISSAHQHTTKAIRQSALQIAPQEVWWWHYQTSLQATRGKPRMASASDLAEPLPSDLFAILDRACELMLDYFGHIGDEGLRRNYLNKVSTNREITLEWTREAAARGRSLAIFTKRETKSTSFEEQFRRLVDIGNRLTAERDPQTLPDTIRNEFVELSGAERAIVALRDEGDGFLWASTLGLDEEEREEAFSFISPFLEKARDTRAPILEDGIGQVLEGEVPELHLRSVIALPLVSQGRLWGVLYGDMRHIFGRFNQQDLSLLNLLANQAASALENADWVRGLEQKVEERTAELQTSNTELEERNAELAIINSIQAGLVEEMEIQAIYDLVGYKLVELFPEANSVGISTIDADRKINHNIFVYEKGKRFYFDPFYYAGAPNEKYLDFLVNTKDVILVNEHKDDFLASFGVVRPLEGTETGKSLLLVPMIVGDQVRGHIGLEDTDREHAFSDADVRLLTTITNAMSMALENARLFNETQSLYTEAQEAKQQAEEARQIAEEASQAKSSFLASMSHELRTPLNAIIGFTRIVKRKARGNLPEKQIDNLGKVQSSAEHLLGLINTVLDIAKIEAGRMEVLASEFEVEALVEMCLATAQPLARPGVEMAASVAPDLPRAYSDQDKIRQILLNTLSNAAKFTHEGRITLQVQQQDGLLIYEVIDSGIGMNEEQLARVFEEFQQAESTTARDYGGTGLGLPISKQLAQLLGGDLVATSIEGEGSTLTLSIPVRYQ